MAKQSLLTESHRRSGAILVEKDGWLLPDHFGDPSAEYESVRSAAGIFDFSHRALLQFTGADRVSFLQGMLSNDLRPLKMFGGQLAAVLTQQGKVIADVRVLCALNSLYLDFWEPLKEKITAHLNRYLVADEVEINDPNDQWKMISLQGPQARKMLDQLLAPADLPTQPNQHAMVQFDGAPICVVRADHSGEGGFDLILQNGQLDAFARRLKQRGASWVGGRAQNILRIEAGIPLYGSDFNEENLLLEVGLENSYSYTKGCYLGQEVVERIRSRGHVNKKLCGLLIDGDKAATPGDKITVEQKEIGVITSSVVSPRLNRPVALGYIGKEHWTPGTEVSIERDGVPCHASVTALPFQSSSSS